MALRDLAGDRVELTLVAPEPDFTYKPLAVEEPFSHQPPEHRALDPIAREFGSRFVQAAVERVALGDHTVELSTGESLPYAMLLVCVGGRPKPAFRQGATFLASGEPLRIDEILANAATRAVEADRLRGPTRRDMAASHLRAGAHGPAARREPWASWSSSTWWSPRNQRR